MDGYPVPPDLAAALWREAEALRKNDEQQEPPAGDAEGRENPDADDDDEDNDGLHRAGDGGENGGEPTDNLERARSAMKEKTMKSQLIDLAKRHGWRAVCKNFVERGSAADVFSETEVTEMLTAVARKMHPDLRPDQAFSKAYSAQTPDGELMRRTTMAARDAQFASRTATMSKAGSSAFHAGGEGYFGPQGSPGRATLQPRVTGGRAAQNVNAPKSALDQINELVAEQRKNHPELSESGAFAAVYTDPKNANLAAKEREENRPTASW